MSYSLVLWVKIWQFFFPSRLEVLKTHHCAVEDTVIAYQELLLDFSPCISMLYQKYDSCYTEVDLMAVRVVEFWNGVYKIRKIFA